LLLRHWRAVEALACALIEQGHIDGDQVARIVTPLLQPRRYQRQGREASQPRP
jgi:hypothetical protein